MKIEKLWMVAALSIVVNGQASLPVVQSVVNAADYSNAIVEGGYISIFGDGLAAATAMAQSVPFPTELGSTSVEIRETTPLGVGRKWKLPLFYVSGKQLSAIMPYALGVSGLDLVVFNGSQASTPRRLSVRAVGPRLFTYSQLGTGTVVLTRANNQLVSATTPMQPGEMMQLYLNSAGPVVPDIEAGMVSGDGRELGPIRRMAIAPEVTVNGRKAEISFAGMSPGSVGLYQINFRAPYEELEGDLSVKVKSGEEESQNGVFVRTLPNGYYWLVTAGKTINGLELDGTPGSSCAFAGRHEEQELWGPVGLRRWTKNLALPSGFKNARGLALTLKNGAEIVFDNNGLETGSTGDYYDNRGGGPDAEKAGLLSAYSNSVRHPLITAGAFRLTSATQITEMIGYFEGPSFLRAYPFFPDNYFNRFRMNIWSNTTGNEPREDGGFVGDVFSSDQAGGKFTFSPTGIPRVYREGATHQIYRLRFELEKPIVLEPGIYWFSHDVAVPKLSGSPMGAAMTITGDGSAKEVLPGAKPYSMRDEQ